MPHSGGGGSHGGGSHHSSSHHHSSHSSHSSGGSSNYYRKSNTPFVGCKTFIYYADNKPHYYYATARTTVTDYKTVGGVILGIAFVTLVAWLLCCISKITVSDGPLPLDYDSAIYIEDNVGLIENEASLVSYLEDFRDETGISVAIVTETTEDSTFGYSITNQAYNAYVQRWDDESHWLIYYVGDSYDRSDDWNWELMCGDNCVSILSESQEDRFTLEFHRRLVASERKSFDEAVTETLSLLTPDTSSKLVFKPDTEFDGEYVSGQALTADNYALLTIWLLLAVTGFIIGIIVFNTKPSERNVLESKAIQFDGANNPKEDACEYCGGTYVIGTVGTCPFCGAPLKVHTY